MSAAKAGAKEVSLDELFQKEMSQVGLAGLLKRAEDYVDMNVQCVSTGFPQLDKILHPDNRTEEEREGQPANEGLPLGRDVEVYSREPEVGKTSLGLAFVKSFQQQGKRPVIVDVAKTITLEYLDEVGIITDPEIADKQGMYVPYIMRADDPEGNPLPAERVFDGVRQASRIADIVLVDDVAALMAEADLEKEASDNTRTGGIAKPITEHMRRTVSKRAAVVWINQQRQRIGFSMPGMPAKYDSMGGKAIPFFGSIRIDLVGIGKIEVGSEQNKEIVGQRIKVYTAKNKVAPPFRSTTLTYLNHEGFSPIYDYFDMALKAKVIEKKGGWFVLPIGDLPGGEKIQGEMNAYRMVRDNPAVFEAVKKALAGKV